MGGMCGLSTESTECPVDSVEPFTRIRSNLGLARLMCIGRRGLHEKSADKGGPAAFLTQRAALPEFLFGDSR